MTIGKCPVCGSIDSKKLFLSCNTHGRHMVSRKESFQVCRCCLCGLVYLNGICVDEKYYKRYYKSGYYDQNFKAGIMNSLVRKLLKFSVKRKEEVILKALKSRKDRISILDIGCGNGDFLLNLNNEKFNKNGIEINKEGFNICKSQGLNVHNKEISKIDFKNECFDVISMWHVLEHIENPLIFLESIKDILNKNGIIVFQVPNTDSFGFKIGKQDWFHLDSPRHLCLYNLKSVKFLAKKSGFQVVETKNEFYDYLLDLFWSVRKSWFGFLIYPLYPFLKFSSKETITVVLKKV